MNNDNDIPPVKKKRMTAADKKAAYSMLVALSIDQQPPRAAFSAVAAYFDVHRTTTARLWKQIQSKIPNLPTNQDDGDDGRNGDDEGRREDDDEGWWDDGNGRDEDDYQVSVFLRENESTAEPVFERRLRFFVGGKDDRG